jgi:hypothetical protein
MTGGARGYCVVPAGRRFLGRGLGGGLRRGVGLGVRRGNGFGRATWCGTWNGAIPGDAALDAQAPNLLERTELQQRLELMEEELKRVRERMSELDA